MGGTDGSLVEVHLKFSASLITKQTNMADSKPPTPSTSSPASTTTVAVNRKRRRTRSHNSSPSPGRGFFVPGFENAAGHKMMSISELMDTARGVTNMYLAHEIAVDKDFMLEKLKPDVQPGSMEEQVKTIVHQALSLLTEIRETMIGLLLPSQTRVKDVITEKLDIDLIAQAANNVLDVKAHALFIIDLM